MRSHFHPRRLSTYLRASPAASATRALASALAPAARDLGGGAPTAPVTPSAATADRVAAILGHPETVGREAQARHLAYATALAPDQAVAILAVGPRGAVLASAMAGAAAARQALGLPADTARDAAVARGVEAALAAPGLWSAPDATPGASEAEEFAAGAAAARKLLGR